MFTCSPTEDGLRGPSSLTTLWSSLIRVSRFAYRFIRTTRRSDYVVQARGAFDQTIQGLHRLAQYEQPVEIRVVLHKLTIPRLYDLAHFIYRNLPFARHVALMGLEITGFTRPNLNKLWIDPYEYQTELPRAVEYLAIRGMNVSIYNLHFVYCRAICGSLRGDPFPTGRMFTLKYAGPVAFVNNAAGSLCRPSVSIAHIFARSVHRVM